jgi:hypothetical protein
MKVNYTKHNDLISLAAKDGFVVGADVRALEGYHNGPIVKLHLIKDESEMTADLSSWSNREESKNGFPFVIVQYGTLVGINGHAYHFVSPLSQIELV